MHPPITVVCTFTRHWAIERWIKDFSKLTHDPKLTSLVFIVDAAEPNIRYQLREHAKTKPYRSVDIIMNEDNEPNEVRIAARRQRIAYVKNQSKALVAHTDCEYVIGLEDDTVFPPETVKKLLKPFSDWPDMGFVEGVQCGRWGVKIIGAWTVDDDTHPLLAETLMPPTADYDYENIEAGGFYGYATPKELYINHEYYSASTQPYGPDVNYGLWLKQQGYDCLIDWSLIFGHNSYQGILYPDNNVASVQFKKDLTTGHWNRKDTEKQ